MGVEFELKFKANPQAQEKLLAAYPQIWQEIAMETTYYDTAGGDLAQKHYTLRSRRENGVAVCTVKTPMGALGRGEWELYCEDIHKAIPQLVSLGAPEDLLAMTAAGVEAVCGARFTRQAGVIPLEGCTVELAVDRGVLFGGAQEQPLCEIEVELKQGDASQAVEFARLLAAKFGLVPEHKSKFARARALKGAQ